MAEIRYSKIKQKEDENVAIQARLKELQGEGAMIKEEVDAEDIAEVVSRWTPPCKGRSLCRRWFRQSR